MIRSAAASAASMSAAPLEPKSSSTCFSTTAATSNPSTPPTPRSETLATSESRRTLVGLLALLALACLAVGCDRAVPAAHAQEGTGGAEEPGGLVVYVVRHAEKQELPGNDDPPLTELGEARARSLPEALPLDRLVAVYSSPFVRTRATVAPAAAAAGLEVVDVDGHDMAGLAERIRAHGEGAVLVAGHTDTVPQLLAELGVTQTIVLQAPDYGDLFIVRLDPEGAQLERALFGP